MAKPKDSVIEDCLRKVVRAAAAKDEDITIRQARSRVEKELGLEEGFFVDSAEWKPRSKDVIHDAFNGDNSEVEEPTPKANAQASQPSIDKAAGKAKPEGKQSKASSSKPAASKGTKSKLSNERVEDADSSDGESNDVQEKNSSSAVQKKPQPPKQVNGVKRKAGESSISDEDSSSDSSSSSEEGHEVEAPQKKKTRREGSSGSGDESDDDSEGESEEDNESQEGSESSEPTNGAAAKIIPAIPPNQFIPPLGFISLDAEHIRVHEALSLPTVGAKQIWHITAPSKLSLSSVTEISLDALRCKQPFLIRDGVEYIANEQLALNVEAPSILLPTENGYQLLEQAIERSFHLQQNISLPNLSIRQADQNVGSSAAAQIGISQTSGAKRQPQGLRMRYKPPGSGSGKPGILGSDSEADVDTQTAANARVSTGLTQDVGAMVVDDGKTQEPSKKSKKKRKSTETGEGSQPTVNGVSKSSSSSAKVSKPSQPTIVNGTSEETLSKEEKKRLKRERREAKQKAKEAAG